MKLRTSPRWLVPPVPGRHSAGDRDVRSIAQKTQLTVYTALETDQLKAYHGSFNKANPNIELNWVRDSTGVITAKLLAEKANPQADVIMGVAATSMVIFEAEGMLAPYAPAGLSGIAAQYRDPKNRRRGSAWTCGARPLLQHRRGRRSVTSRSPRAGRT